MIEFTSEKNNSVSKLSALKWISLGFFRSVNLVTKLQWTHRGNLLTEMLLGFNDSTASRNRNWTS